MLLYLGGACAGKRAVVSKRFASRAWHSAYRGDALDAWPLRAGPNVTLVLEGWERWLAAMAHEEDDDDRLRASMAARLDALCQAERRDGMTVVLIMLEMGRGIVPMAPSKRRLRDLNGWLAQDAAARSEEVWEVWHGLSRRTWPLN